MSKSLTILSALLLAGVSSILDARLVTNPNLTTNLKCGDTDGYMQESRVEEVLHMTLLSPTTFRMQILDNLLQENRKFHPLKCHDDFFGYGVLRIISQPCQLESDDEDACFSMSNFRHPMPPYSQAMKIDMHPKGDGTGWKDPVPGRKYKWSRENSSKNGNFALEVCGLTSLETGGCKDKSGVCIQASALLALDPESYTEKVVPDNQWSDMAVRPANDPRNYLDVWDQPHALPKYGPFPPCPEDWKGRAVPCHGNETLTISIRHLSIDQAQVDPDGSVRFAVSYDLEWGDRYAVHPCTVNLFPIFTGGRPYRIPSDRFWKPSFSVPKARKAAKIVHEENTLGVNFGFGTPVKKAVEADADLPWPKQLVLSHHYSIEYYPSIDLDWTKYPYDSQHLELLLLDYSVAPGIEHFDTSSLKFEHNEAKLGDSWTKSKAGYSVVTVDGRSAFKVYVDVTRNPGSKRHTLILPMVTVAMFEIAFHLIVPYSDSAKLFMTKALIISVGLNLMNPVVLGIPSTVKGMPFAQCMALMIVLGALKTSLLFLVRYYFEKKVTDVKSEIASLLESFGKGSTFGLDASLTERTISEARTPESASPKVAPETESAWHDVGQAKYKHYLELLRRRGDASKHLNQIDRIIRCSVPAWYFISWLSVSGSYGVL